MDAPLGAAGTCDLYSVVEKTRFEDFVPDGGKTYAVIFLRSQLLVVETKQS